MKIPRVIDVKTAIVLAVSAVVAAVFIAIFGPVVAYVLAMVSFISGSYAAGLTWAPEFFGEAPKKDDLP